MYINTRQRNKIAIFLAVFLLLFLAIVVAVFYDVKGSVPENIILSNVQENSVTITWTTDSKIDGHLVLYDEKGEEIGKFEDSRDIGRSYTHYINVTGLRPDTVYEFELFSGKKEMLNENGRRFRFSTSEIMPLGYVSSNVTGFFDERDLLVFLLIDDSNINYPVSGYVRGDDSWSLDLSTLTPVNRSENYILRADTDIKVLFYSHEGSKIIRGSKNALFDNDGVFNYDNLVLDGIENIFLQFPEVFKLRNGLIVDEDVLELDEIVENTADEILNEDLLEEVLGTEIADEFVENDVIWEPLDSR